jgi:protein involved in polysaccharide export with SLBB domain
MLLTACFSVFYTFSVEAQSVPLKAYEVGINDVIRIEVAGHQDISLDFSVALDGTIPYPYLGAIYVEGKTLKEIQDEITKKLDEGYVKSPVVSVALKQSLSKKIYVYGSVVESGVYPYEHNLTVGKILLIAGGLKNPSTYGKVIVRRKRENESGFSDISLDLKDILRGNTNNDMSLIPDDIVIIESAEKVFVQGEVEKPKSYILEENMTVGRVLSLAGGITEGGLYGKVRVRRIHEDGSGYDDIELDLKGVIEGHNSEDMLLQPDDIVIVERNKTFFIHGEVNRTGKYTLEENMTVVKAITEAGGIKESGLYGTVKIRRKIKDEAGYEDIKVNLKGIISGAVKEETLIQPNDILIIERNKTFLLLGEIVNPGDYELEDNMTVRKAITKAGGVLEGVLEGKVRVRRILEGGAGYDDIEIDLKSIINGDSEGDMPLKPDDIVVVERGKTYIIYGEVERIGEYPISKDMTVFKAIIKAGGFNKWGSARRIKVLRPKDDGEGFNIIKVNIKKLLDGNPNADIPVNAGDIIIVSSGIL